MSTTYSAIQQSIGSQVAKADSEMQTFSQTMDPTSTADMLKMQQKMQEWNMVVSLQSTIIKDIGDALKGIIQKSG
jgi:type III secretion protein F